MPNVTIATIREIRKKEKYANTSLRLQACFYRKKNYSTISVELIAAVYILCM